MATAKHVFVTGQPGVGKSTLISSVLGRLQQGGGLPIGSFQGFWTCETRSASGERSGFDIVTWEADGSSKRGALARLGSAPRGAATVGKYVVDTASVQLLALPVLRLGAAGAGRGAAAALPQLVVIDEVGRMELCCPGFMAAVWEALDAGPVVLGSVPAARNGRAIPDVERLKARPDATVVPVTKANRDELVGQLAAMVGMRVAACGRP